MWNHFELFYHHCFFFLAMLDFQKSFEFPQVLVLCKIQDFFTSFFVYVRKNSILLKLVLEHKLTNKVVFWLSKNLDLESNFFTSKFLPLDTTMKTNAKSLYVRSKRNEKVSEFHSFLEWKLYLFQHACLSFKLCSCKQHFLVSTPDRSRTCFMEEESALSASNPVCQSRPSARHVENSCCFFVTSIK